MYKNLFAVFNSVANSKRPTCCEAIAKETGLSVRTVQRITKEWVKRGFFGLERLENCNGYFYYLKKEKP